MGFLEKVYDRSPIFFQNIMTSVAGYKKNRTRYGKTYYDYREFLIEFDEYSLEDKLAYQKEKLIDFIKYVHNHSPFYQELYKGIDFASINKLSDLKKLPVVDKELIREHNDRVMTVSRGNSVESRTGGTTGKSLNVRFTIEDYMKRMAMLDHFKSRVGFEHLKMRRATFNGKHIIPPSQKAKNFWRYNAACKQMIYSSFNITEENMKYYVESLNKFKPHAIDGFFTSMLDIAGYIERHNIELTFQPVAIFPTSETLTDTGRELLERVFKCKVYDQYASSEGAPFVTECENQQLHVELASGVFEHYKEDSDEILVTSFTTHGTPLIRYKIGDTMNIYDNQFHCKCNNQSPLVKSIQGRKTDYLLRPDGAKITTVNIANAFKSIPNGIIRTQTIQNQIDEIIILLEVDTDKYKTEYDFIVRDEFFRRFGKDTEIVIKHVNEIPRESSGKFRMIKNNFVL